MFLKYYIQMKKYDVILVYLMYYTGIAYYNNVYCMHIIPLLLF